MTLRSMTGYGRAEVEKQSRTWTVEVRSVNNRFLDAKIKLPRDYGLLEDEIRKKIALYHQRGRVDLTLSVVGDFSDLVNIRVNTGIARTYKEAMEELAVQLEIESHIDIKTLVELPDVLTREQQAEDIGAIWPVIETIVDKALGECLEMREREAGALTSDLIERLANFNRIVGDIEARIPELIRQKEENLNERLEKLLGMVALDPMRLAQEVAILADKTDVTEELVRLRSHISQFEGLLKVSEPVGRKLDFLIQEFLREVNTLASKINDADIAHMTVVLKSELEKMREQVQNIE